MTIDSITQRAFSGLIGKECCLQRVGEYRSFIAGFGSKITNMGSSKKVVPFLGEWEIRSDMAAWRIISGESILFGSKDLVDSEDEFNRQFQNFTFGAVIAIEMISKFDVRIRLDNDISVDFVAIWSDEDEIISIFGPEHLYVEYTVKHGWLVGKSDKPWNRESIAKLS